MQMKAQNALHFTNKREKANQIEQRTVFIAKNIPTYSLKEIYERIKPVSSPTHLTEHGRVEGNLVEVDKVALPTV